MKNKKMTTVKVSREQLLIIMLLGHQHDIKGELLEAQTIKNELVNKFKCTYIGTIQVYRLLDVLVQNKVIALKRVILKRKSLQKKKKFYKLTEFGLSLWQKIKTENEEHQPKTVIEETKELVINFRKQESLKRHYEKIMDNYQKLDNIYSLDSIEKRMREHARQEWLENSNYLGFQTCELFGIVPNNTEALVDKEVESNLLINDIITETMDHMPKYFID